MVQTVGEAHPDHPIGYLPMSPLPRSPILLALAALTLGVVAPSAFAGPAPERRSALEVVAHRGASADAPENTLAAVREGLRQRADVIEVDVQRTRDGELVILHDRTLVRTTDVETVHPTRALAPVDAFTLAELRSLDAGSWFDPRFAGERIPTLGELVVARGNAGLLVEIKEPAAYPGIEAQVADALADVPRGKVVVQSFDAASMRRHDAIAPEVAAGQLVWARPSPAELDGYAPYAEQTTPTFRVMDEALAGAIRARGMSPGVYTVDDEADMRRMIGVGVDRIITNRPGVLRALVDGAGSAR